MRNVLWFGDNLHVLRKHIKDESVDLVYLDPPFKSDSNYNVLFKSPVGKPSDAQAHAFEDTWRWGTEAELALDDVRERSLDTFKLLRAMQDFLGHSDVMAYLAMMAVRLVELRRVMKDTATLYLHCDPTASHYLKILLDGIFGAERFQNEIIWQRTTPKGHAFTRFPSTHDVLLAFRKSDAAIWNTMYLAHRDEYVRTHYANIEEETGRRYMLDNCLNPNRDRPNLTYEWHGHTRVWRWTKERMQSLHREGRLIYTRSGMPRYKRYLDEMKGTPATSVWTDIAPLNSQARERLGYPTQKPLSLLDRIIQASSNPGDVVLDPFCGCGTTIHSAEKLGRHWIGIDITHLAIQIIEDRLKTWLSAAQYEVRGIPKTEDEARALAQLDAYQFQLWAVSRLNGQPRGRGADRGVDGEIAFKTGTRSYGHAIVSVKSGKNVNPGMVRDLVGTVANQGADAGVFVCLDPPTPEMKIAAASAGVVETAMGKQSKIQIVTVEDLIAGPQLGLGLPLNTIAAAHAARIKPKTAKRPIPTEPQFYFSVSGGKANRAKPVGQQTVADKAVAGHSEAPVHAPKKRAPLSKSQRKQPQILLPLAGGKGRRPKPQLDLEFPEADAVLLHAAEEAQGRGSKARIRTSSRRK